MSRAYAMRVEPLIAGDRDLLKAAARSIGRTWWAQRDRLELTQEDVRVATGNAISQPQLSNLQNGYPVSGGVSDQAIVDAFGAVGLTDETDGVAELMTFVMWWRDFGWE